MADARSRTMTPGVVASPGELRLLPFPAMQACSSCGATTDEAGRFCPGCGGVLMAAPAAAEAVSAPAPRVFRVPPTQKISDPAAPGDAASHDAAAAAAASQATPAASLLGTTIGDFEIEAVIGGGSFGTVYRGRQRGLDRPVAIKVPTYEIAADPVQAERFAREARAAARIVHPGVVAIYGVGELADGRPYLAMQLIDGVPLDRILADGPLPARRALAVARDIASALSDTHAAGVVHRDLKPSNVMWRRDRNGDDRITLVDFGIAVCRPGHADATRLTTNGLIGTPHYMSPEQAHGEVVDARADLYALGCLTFELVTGSPPFEGSGFEVLLAHLGRPAPLASERNPGVPAVVDQLIARLMQKPRDDRPASADAVVAMIDAATATLDGPSARPARSPRSAARSAARATAEGPRAAAAATTPLAVATATASATRNRRSSRRWLVAGVLGAIALSGAGFAAYRLRGGDAPDAPEPAETAQGAPVSSTGELLRLISRDDGELIVKTLIPETIHTGTETRAHIEIKTKLGGAFSAKQVVVTIEDPHHNASALTAAIHDNRPGHYAFHHTFTEPGSYVIRIFPSETETVSTLELEVAP